MKQRNVIIAGVSLTATCAAIGVGAMVSASAMAPASDVGTATVTIMSVGTDGQAPVSCTFDDVTLPPLRVGADDGGGVVVSGGGAVPVTGSGVIEMPPGGSGELPSLGELVESGPVSVEEGVAPLDPSGGVLVSADEARPGTADECAAMRAQLELGS